LFVREMYLITCLKCLQCLFFCMIDELVTIFGTAKMISIPNHDHP